MEFRRHNLVRMAVAAFGFGWLVMATGMMPAAAIELRPSVQSGISPGEVQNLRNREMRRAFQDQQQLLRDLDRQRFSAPQPRPNVPVMRGNCQVRVFGNQIVPSCR